MASRLVKHPLASNLGGSDEAVLVMPEYLKHLYAVPNCPCVTYRLGLPTLVEIVDRGRFAAHCDNPPS